MHTCPVTRLAKFVGYREILSRDLLVEDREAERLMRKHSLHRTHSRRTSSVPRQRSHASLSRVGSARHGKMSNDLTRSHTPSLRPPALLSPEADLSPRHSFDSGVDSLSAAEDAPEGPHHSLTDDELDRVRSRAPPPMQRSKTETDWEHVGPFLGPLRLRDFGKTPASGDDSAPTESRTDEDELEERVGEIDWSTRRTSRTGSTGGGGDGDDASLV